MRLPYCIPRVAPGVAAFCCVPTEVAALGNALPAGPLLALFVGAAFVGVWLLLATTACGAALFTG